jgi:hypothetical protein
MRGTAIGIAFQVGATLAILTCLPSARGPVAAAPADLTATFQTLEQSLMNAVGVGDKAVWSRAMDEACVMTDEEGGVSTKKDFLQALGPLPPGLSGEITVRDLTVQAFPTFVVVRFLADEWEQVFGQRLTTKYRTTDTFRLVGTDWKMVASHTSVVTADPPAQTVDTSGWPRLVGAYRLLPDGWTYHVELRNGVLLGGRDPAALKPFIPLTPVAFVRHDTLGEFVFVVGKNGDADAIVELRKFEPLVWTRVRRAGR